MECDQVRYMYLYFDFTYGIWKHDAATLRQSNNQQFDPIHSCHHGFLRSRRQTNLPLSIWNGGWPHLCLLDHEV